MTDAVYRRFTKLIALLLVVAFGLVIPAEAQTVADNQVHERILLTTNRVVYQSAQDFTFSIDSVPKGPAGTTTYYTWFIYVQRSATGDRWYYPSFQPGEVTDILGNVSNFPTFEVPTLSDFQLLGSNGWMGRTNTSLAAAGITQPGMYSLVEELRDASAATVLFTTRTQFVLVNSVQTLSGTIGGNTTLTNDRAYLLSGAVFVQNGITLTIQPGTVILGQSATNGTLVIAQGGKINAVGTWASPIIFTSDQPVGQRARADWGGLIINGRAPLNVPGGQAIGEGDTGTYGGTDPADSSGTLKYVRVEYAGTEFSPDNELNGIAFQGVGNGTVVDYIQVHFNQDDGVEFFGGTVNVKHVLLTNIRDDSIDWTEGWIGKGQSMVAQQNGQEADNGIEADNSAENNDLLPRSNPTIYNFTLIGDPDAEQGTESDDGMLIREGTAGTFRNFIVTGFKEIGINVDHAATIAQGQSGALSFDNAIVFGNTPNFDADATPFVTGKNIAVVDPQLVDPFSHTFPDFRPAKGSPALDAKRVKSPPDDGFFDAGANFLGGVGPTDNWVRGWTTSHLR
jgi:hypothetical protein